MLLYEVQFKDLDIGTVFYRTANATDADKKIEPVTNNAGTWNIIGVLDGVMGRRNPDTFVYIEE